MGVSWLFSRDLELADHDRANRDFCSSVELVFKKYNPEYPFEYKFVDEAYAKKFDNEQRQGTLAALFAGLTNSITAASRAPRSVSQT